MTGKLEEIERKINQQDESFKKQEKKVEEILKEIEKCSSQLNAVEKKVKVQTQKIAEAGKAAGERFNNQKKTLEKIIKDKFDEINRTLPNMQENQKRIEDRVEKVMNDLMADRKTNSESLQTEKNALEKMINDHVTALNNKITQIQQNEKNTENKILSLRSDLEKETKIRA